MAKLKYSFFASVIIALVVQAVPAAALTYAEVAGQGRVLGESAAYPYSSAALASDGGTIYFINGTTKIPFTSWKAFVGLGYALKNVVKGDLSNYTLSPSYVINTANAVHPWGQWLSNRSTIYYSSQQGLIAVPSAEIFLSNGGQWKFVVKANKYDLAALKANPGLALLADSDSRVAVAPSFAFGGNNLASPTLSNPNPTAANPLANNIPASPIAIIPGVPGVLNSPILSTTSPAGQFVLAGGTGWPMATFNFSASVNGAVIQELDFMVSTNVNGIIIPPISWVSAGGGGSAVLSGATTTISGLNIVVPTSTAVSVPVSVNFASFNPPNSLTNQVFTLNLVGIKYLSAGQSVMLGTNVASNAMDLVTSIPSVSISGPAGPLYDGLTLLGYVTVGATGGAGITLDQLPIILTVTGNPAASSSPNNLQITDNGNPVDTSNNAVNFVGTSTTPSTIVFNNDNSIGPNSSKTYAISLVLQGAVGSSVGYSSVGLSLGSPSGFIFNDVAAGIGGLNLSGTAGGAAIPNYSTNVVTAHN